MDLPHVQEFSGGYWIIDGLFVVPNEDTDVPVVHEYVYEQLHDTYYEDRPTPILFRHGNAKYHFEVHPNGSVPSNTVEMPYEMTSDMDIDAPPREEQFLMTKPAQAQMLYTMKNNEIEG